MRLFVLLASLHMIDGIFAFYFLQTGATYEDNPILNWLWHVNPLLYLGFKLLLSLVIVYVGLVLKEKKIQSIYINTFVSVASIVFLFIIGVQVYILTLI